MLVFSTVADVAKKTAAENANARGADRQMATIISLKLKKWEFSGITFSKKHTISAGL